MFFLQSNIVKAKREFPFHPAFVGWEGARYEESTTEDGKRTYVINGFAYPSVTTMLAADPDKQASLAMWRKRVGDEQAELTSSSATRRGRKLHALCESFLKSGSVDIKTHLERENFFKVKGKLEERLGNLYAIESVLFSHRLYLAGRCDLIADWKYDTGQYLPTVVDFKTSTKTKYRDDIDHYFIQASAYATMFGEMTGLEIPRIAIVIATEELNEAQVFLEKTKTWTKSLDDAINIYNGSVHAKKASN